MHRVASFEVERLFSSEGHPAPTEVTVADLIDSLDPSARAPENRPWIAANMVSSLDGRASVEGGSTGLGGPTDSELLLGLRTRFDAVMIGAGTLRAEGYGPIIRDPAIREEREARGLEPVPVAVVMTRSGDLPFDCGLFTEGIGRVVVVTAAFSELPPMPTPVEVVEPAGGDSVEAAIDHLHRQGVRSILCEGGPDILGQLIDAGHLDELFLTFTPVITGEVDAPHVVEGLSPDLPIGFDLVDLLTADGDLFTRYRPRR